MPNIKSAIKSVKQNAEKRHVIHMQKQQCVLLFVKLNLLLENKDENATELLRTSN